MSYDTYMFDGGHARWWTFEPDDELDYEVEINSEGNNLDSNQIAQFKRNEENFSILNSFNAESFSCDELKIVLFNRISKRGVLYAASRYCRLENLPKQYASMAINKCRISDVICQNLKSLFNNSVEIHEFEVFIRNEVAKIRMAYDRVAVIQAEIHNRYTLKNGHNSNVGLPKENMRKILSYSRLYFLIRDIERYSIEDLYSDMKYNRFLKINTESRPFHLINTGANFIPRWSARFRNTIYFYFRKADRDFVRTILAMRKCQDKDELLSQLSIKMPSTSLI